MIFLYLSYFSSYSYSRETGPRALLTCHSGYWLDVWGYTVSCNGCWNKSTTKRSNDIPALQKKHLPSSHVFIFFFSWNCHFYDNGGFWVLNTASFPQVLVPSSDIQSYMNCPYNLPPSLSLNMPFKKNNYWRICTFNFLGLKWLKGAWCYCVYFCANRNFTVRISMLILIVWSGCLKENICRFIGCTHLAWISQAFQESGSFQNLSFKGLVDYLSTED